MPLVSVLATAARSDDALRGSGNRLAKPTPARGVRGGGRDVRVPQFVALFGIVTVADAEAEFPDPSVTV